MEQLIESIKKTLEMIPVNGRSNIDRMLGVFLALDELERRIGAQNGESTD